MKRWRPIAVLLAILALWWWQGGTQQQESLPQVASQQTSPTSPSPREATLPDFLPSEAHQTLDLILRGGPFPHRQDGAIFGNREKHLPSQPRGHYREYTVRTPGERDRGARRIITGGDPPREFWYTADHYQTFRRFEVAP